MSLQNLAKIGLLHEHRTGPLEVRRLLAAAERSNATVLLLDSLRKKRNVADYDGDLVSEAELAECLVQARALLVELYAWLGAKRPDLLT